MLEYRPTDENNNFTGERAQEIILNNYILFTGCSHTKGVGLALEDTYPYLLAQKLNCDYYNLALGGTGQDVMGVGQNPQQMTPANDQQMQKDFKKAEI